MPPVETVFAFELKRSKIVAHVGVLTVHQMLNAMKTPDIAKAKNETEATVYINAEILRMSLRRINGEAVKYVDLNGDELVDKLGGRQRNFTAIVANLGQLYATTRYEREDAINKAKIEVTDFTEFWTVTLFDGRKVKLKEVHHSTMGRAIGEAEEKSRSTSAGQLLAMVESLRNSIVAVEGKPVDAKALEGRKWDALFSVRETRLLGHVYDHIHGGEEVAVGELKPSDGTK